MESYVTLSYVMLRYVRLAYVMFSYVRIRYVKLWSHASEGRKGHATHIIASVWNHVE